MKILISNDDGIRAEGLEALVRVLSPRHEVIVSAPLKQQSGMSHALTVGRPMEILVDDELPARYHCKAYAVDGTPTDAVKLYLEALADQAPDVVLSGINHGANLATDVIYSGTVGAAVEGFQHDIPAFAISLDSKSTLSFDEAAEIFLPYMESLLKEKKEPFLYNVNFPKELRAGDPDFRMTRLGKRDYLNAFCREKREDGRTFYNVHGDIYDADQSEGTDLYAAHHGSISVTPLLIDLTNHEMLR